MLHRLVCICLSLIAAALPAQDAAQKPVRVHIIGASVSGGFKDGPMFGAKEQGDSVALQHLLKRWADGEARVTTHNTIEMTTFFANPIVTPAVPPGQALIRTSYMATHKRAHLERALTALSKVRRELEVV